MRRTTPAFPMGGLSEDGAGRPGARGHGAPDRAACARPRGDRLQHRLDPRAAAAAAALRDPVRRHRAGDQAGGRAVAFAAASPCSRPPAPSRATIPATSSRPMPPAAPSTSSARGASRATPRPSWRALPVADADILAETRALLRRGRGRAHRRGGARLHPLPAPPAALDGLAPWPVTWIDPAPAIARRVVQLIGGPVLGYEDEDERRPGRVHGWQRARGETCDTHCGEIGLPRIGVEAMPLAARSVRADPRSAASRLTFPPVSPYCPPIRAVRLGPRELFYAPVARRFRRPVVSERGRGGRVPRKPIDNKEEQRCRSAFRPSISLTAAWARISGAARRAPSTAANTARASTASAARARCPTSARSCAPSRSSRATTPTSPRSSSAATTRKRSA